jgi:hypothetical protein
MQKHTKGERMPLSPKEFAELHKLAPLSDKERRKGKSRLCISNTDELMPWNEIYSRIAIGEPIENIAEKYGHKRKIVLWAIEDNITVFPELSEVLLSEVEQRRKTDAIEQNNPVLARTIKEVANEYAPDAARKAVGLSIALLNAGKQIIDDGEYSSNDLKNIADMMQKTTDTLELTQRHASAANVNQNNIVVNGFDFVLDLPTTQGETIEADIYTGSD